MREGTGDGSEWTDPLAIEKVDLVMQELYWRGRGRGFGGEEGRIPVCCGLPGSFNEAGHREERTVCVLWAGKCGDRMISLVWESCLFPNLPPSLPPSLLLLLLLLSLYLSLSLSLLYIQNHHSQR